MKKFFEDTSAQITPRKALAIVALPVVATKGGITGAAVGAIFCTFVGNVAILTITTIADELFGPIAAQAVLQDAIYVCVAGGGLVGAAKATMCYARKEICSSSKPSEPASSQTSDLLLGNSL